MSLARTVRNSILGAQDVEERSALSLSALAQMGSWGTLTHAGEHVDAQKAIRTSAVAGCRRVIVSSLLSMPAQSFTERDGKMTRNENERRIVKKPSVRLSRRAWFAQMANSLVLDGNMAGLVTEWTTTGHPLQMEPVPLNTITWSKEKGSGLDLGMVNGVYHRLFPLGPLVIQQATPYLRAGQLLADSPVDLALEQIGTSLAAEKFGSQFFGEGAHPHAVIKSDQDLTKSEADGIKSAIRKSWTGREPAVLGSGLEFMPVEVNPKDSQFIDLMRFEIEQICRFFGCPPSMVYAAVSGQAVTYVNIAQDDLQFLKHSLRSWVDDIEEFWSGLLPGPQEVRLKPEGLLRMDPTGRHSLYASRLASKSMTVNEIRLLEDEEPFDDPAYDLPGIPGGTPQAEPEDEEQEEEEQESGNPDTEDEDNDDQD